MVLSNEELKDIYFGAYEFGETGSRSYALLLSGAGIAVTISGFSSRFVKKSQRSQESIRM